MPRFVLLSLVFFFSLFRDRTDLSETRIALRSCFNSVCYKHNYTDCVLRNSFREFSNAFFPQGKSLKIKDRKMIIYRYYLKLENYLQHLKLI